jgi:hypothetical protein
MFKFSAPPELPPQLQWEYAHEPELLGWTIRARNYNTFVANCMFAFMCLVVSGWAIFIYSATHHMSQFSRILTCIVFALLALSTISFMTHQRMKFAYRFTHSGVEYCEWKDFPKWALPFLKWMTGITAIFFIFMATIDPTFLIGALIGPGGMGLTYLSMAHSKSYRELHTEYHHHFLKWEELTQLTVATNREMVELEYSVPRVDSQYRITGSLYVFCKRQQKSAVAESIKPHLNRETPFITGKVDVFS